MRLNQLAGNAHRRYRRASDAALYDLTADGYGGRPVPLAALCERVAQAGDLHTLSACSVLGWCAALCAESPVAGTLWDFAASRDWTLGFGETGRAAFVADCGRSLLVLNALGHSPSGTVRSAHLKHDLFANLVLALREIWQEASVPAAAGLHHMPEDMLILERVRTADAESILLAVAWELREAGRAGVWRHLIGGDRGDLAEAFSDGMEQCRHGLDDAAGEAFRQWYADPVRIEIADRQTLEMLDRHATDGGAEAGGTPDEVPELIEALSELPGGPRYLDGMGWAIRNDPSFSAIGSVVTRSHLLHLTADRHAVSAPAIPFRDKALGRLIFPD